MSGHLAFIVSAYGVAAALMVAEVWALVRRSRRLARARQDETPR
jgi:heme exporter protein CcmD